MSRSTLLRWWPFSPGEWLQATNLLDPLAQAAIMRLNCSAWLNTDDPGHLPDNDAKLCAASGLSAAAWKRHKADVLKFFPKHESAPRVRVASMVSDIYTAQKELHRQRVDNGRATGFKKGEKKQQPHRKGSSSAYGSAYGSADSTADSEATGNAPLDVIDLRTTQEAKTCALPESTEVFAIAEYHTNSSDAAHGESASSTACAPFQGAPPTPLGESTNGEPPQQPRRPALHSDPVPNVDENWERFAPREPRRANAPPIAVGDLAVKMVEKFREQTSPDNAA